ncbi:aldose 1-epimerase [Scaptodrosophila lebanonensis]|uniref:Galactose mutarotase n=1 Tax=Drosophila lebanonensis TaxID=7225 RepID=A0A6J2TRV5_DROLE|nr:aldose 1-epimerase [Scaptodrosophila lebanonensis]
MIKVKEDIFGMAVNPFTGMAQVVRRYTISNANRLTVAIIQLGATVQSIKAPDAEHNVNDIILGFDDVAGYLMQQDKHIGCVLGRVAGIVSNGEFVMEERKVILTRNYKNKHQMDGGFIGLDKVIWDLDMIRPDGVTLRHISKDGHEGYAGNLKIMVHYTVDNDNRFFIRIEATTDHITPVNIASNLFFNIAGHKSGKNGLWEHRVNVKANATIAMDSEGIPTGRYKNVDDTLADLRMAMVLGDRLRQMEEYPTPGYDVNYVLNTSFEPNTPKFVARFVHPESGRFMDVHTNQPGMYFATANFFPNEARGQQPIMGKECTRYWKHCAFNLRLQKFPDSVNNLDFPTTALSSDDRFFSETVLRFGVQETWKCCAQMEEDMPPLEWNNATMDKRVT